MGGIFSIRPGIKPKAISQVRDGKDEENKIFKIFAKMFGGIDFLSTFALWLI